MFLRFFHFLAGGIDHDAAQPAGLPFLADNRHDILQPDRAAILGNEAVLEGMVFQPGSTLRTVCRRPIPVIRMQVPLPEPGPAPLLRRVTQQPFGLAADIGEGKSTGVSFPDDAVHRIDQILEAEPLVFQLVLGLALFGDVAGDSQNADQAAFGVMNRGLDCLQKFTMAVIGIGDPFFVDCGLTRGYRFAVVFTEKVSQFAIHEVVVRLPDDLRFPRAEETLEAGVAGLVYTGCIFHPDQGWDGLEQDPQPAALVFDIELGLLQLGDVMGHEVEALFTINLDRCQVHHRVAFFTRPGDQRKIKVFQASVFLDDCNGPGAGFRIPQSKFEGGAPQHFRGFPAGPGFEAGVDLDQLAVRHTGNADHVRYHVKYIQILLL